MRLLPILLLTACATADAGSFYAGASLGGGATAAEARQYGIQIDWTSVTTITINEGQRLADDGTTFTVSSPFAVTFADIDTGAEANAGYYVWLTGDSSAVLSLSATAPTGVTAKYLAGWVYNDSGSDIVEFRTDVAGDSLNVWWVPVPLALNSAAEPATYTAHDVSTGGHAPSSTLVDGLELSVTGRSTTTPSSVKLSSDGTEDGPILYAQNTEDGTLDAYLPTQGSTFWWLRGATGGTQQVLVSVNGFRLDRSGI